MNERGVSFVELILVVAAVAILALLINTLPSSISSINKSRHASIAREIVTKQIDYLRKQNYTNLANGINTFSDPSLSSLPLSSASYDIENCPADVCSNGENAKEVKVSVFWNESGDSKSVELVTIISEEGVGQ